MASKNSSTKKPPIFTHEGGRAVHITPLQELKRTVLTALLWEDTFYEKGSDIAKRMAELIPKCNSAEVAALAIEAREKMYLRHVGLHLVRELARTKGNGSLVADTLARIIQRPDELTEYVAIYTAGKAANKAPKLSAGSKRGLRRAFAKFSPYQLSKYKASDKAIKLVDVLRLVHPKPSTEGQKSAFKALREGTLVSTDTWESQLSAGKDKKETFEGLLKEQKLGGLAFLRNLRNMVQAGVNSKLIRERFAGTFPKVLPFRFLAAARHNPSLADDINTAMLGAVVDNPEIPTLKGKTIVLVDVSGSMNAQLRWKSEMVRMDAATGLAALLREKCEEVQIFSFSDKVVEVPNHRGIPLANAIVGSQIHSGTYLGNALSTIDLKFSADRLIVITDEQSHDRVPITQFGLKYLINVAPYKHGVGYNDGWIHIDGFSERILDYIAAVEREIGSGQEHS